MLKIKEHWFSYNSWNPLAKSSYVVHGILKAVIPKSNFFSALLCSTSFNTSLFRS